jgi:hypothetical protein
MQAGTLQLIFALALMGGGIAYLADLLGRTLGKKRLTIGHMRPKHTAALLTTTAGVLIPVVTLGLLYIVSADVRVMLTETELARRKLIQIEHSLQKTEKSLDAKAQEVADLTQLKEELVVTKNSLSQDKVRLTSDKQKLSGEIGRVKTNLRVQTKLAENLRRQAVKLQSTFRSLSASVAAKTSEVAALTKEAKTQKQTTEVQQRLLKDLSDRETELDIALRKAESNLRAAEAEVKGLQEVASTVKRQTEATAQLLQEQVRLAQEEVQKARKDYDDLVSRTLEYQRAVVMLEGSASAARTRDLIFKRNEEVARTISSAGATLAEARDAYESLLRISRNEATRRGAVRDAEYGLARLLPIENSNGTLVPLEELEANLFKRILGKNEPQVLIARAPANIFSGEWLPITVDVLPNTVVYREGQIIVETRIDGAQDERRILDAIGDFIRDRVAPQAIKDEMIPKIGSDAGLGEVSDDEILRLVKEISALGRFVRVQAVAAQQTRRADRLQLKFVLK